MLLIQSDLQKVHFSEESETTIYRCHCRKDFYLYIFICLFIITLPISACLQLHRKCTEDPSPHPHIRPSWSPPGSSTGAHQPAQLPEGEVGVPGLDDGPHLAAEQDVAAHVDLPLGALLLREPLDGLWR